MRLPAAIGWALLLWAIALRILLVPGLMPADGRAALVLCTASGAASLPVEGGAPSADHAASHCMFASVTPALPPPELLPTVPQLALAGPAHAMLPIRGRALPGARITPPATGPPYTG